MNKDSNVPETLRLPMGVEVCVRPWINSNKILMSKINRNNNDWHKQYFLPAAWHFSRYHRARIRLSEEKHLSRLKRAIRYWVSMFSSEPFSARHQAEAVYERRQHLLHRHTIPAVVGCPLRLHADRSCSTDWFFPAVGRHCDWNFEWGTSNWGGRRCCCTQWPEIPLRGNRSGRFGKWRWCQSGARDSRHLPRRPSNSKCRSSSRCFSQLFNQIIWLFAIFLALQALSLMNWDLEV